jgi:4'-phosphopantetheinyl transferase
MQTSPQHIDLWLAPDTALEGLATHASGAEWLSEEEQRRWQCFARAADRTRYLLSRVMMRSVLAQQLQPSRSPQSLIVVQDHHGKPHLQPPALQFNLSHTDGLVVLAVSDTMPVGVDVEQTSREVAALALAQRYFSTREVKALEALDGTAQRELFFAQWTLKEAWLKAKGTGLRVPLDAFAFELGPTGDIKLHCDAQLNELPQAWGFWRHVRGRHRIALAYPRSGDTVPVITVREWQAQDLLR